MEFINIEKFIQCVKEKPMLYDPNSDEYRNMAAKNRAWEEIAKAMVGNGTWNSMNKEKKLKTAALVQNRWRCLRGCYKRALRQRQEKRLQGVSNTMSYIYEKNLTFLLPHFNINASNDTVSPSLHQSEDTRDDQSDEQSCNYDETEECDQKTSVEENSADEKGQNSKTVSTSESGELMNFINIEKLIECVKNKPMLYDANADDYRNMIAIKKAWEEIAKSMVGDSRWKSMNKDKRLQTAALVQSRWRCLRICYSRALRKALEKKRKGIANPTPYIYEKNLTFLLPHLNVEHGPGSALPRTGKSANLSRSSCRNSNKDTTGSSQNQTEDIADDHSEHSCSDDRKMIIEENTADVGQRPNHSTENNEDIIDAPEDVRRQEQKSIRPGNEPQQQQSKREIHALKRRLLKNIEEKLDVQEDDPDRMFLLSLLPHFKKIKARDQIHAKIRIMHTINGFIAT